MLTSIWNDLRKQYDYGNMVTRLIIVNVGIYVVVNVVKFILFLTNGGARSPFFDTVLHWFCVSSDFEFLLTHPWGIFTSIFLHEGFWHILWNMLFLWWFGRVVGDLIGNHRILPLYLLGGLVGAVAFIISANLLQYGVGGRFALGASGAVTAIAVAAATLAPDYIFRLILLGDVKLKYIVAVMLFLDIIAIADDINTGGHFAHLGGAGFGWFFVYQLQNGTDMAAPVNRLLDAIQKFFSNAYGTVTGKGSNLKVAYKNPKKRSRSQGSVRGNASSDNQSSSYQEQLDAILDKIKEKGYDSLSAEEKEFLFNASKK
jgi:membrane associated rhomboid family serine protease